LPVAEDALAQLGGVAFIMGPRIHYTGSGHVSIAYQVLGEGPVDLIMVPGLVSHLETMREHPTSRRFLERLASFSRLILFDRRGMGLSDRPAEPPTLEQSMADVLAVMDAAGSERAALFGVSEGGPMSMLFAATYPERTAALALYGTLARYLAADDYACGLPLEVLEAFSELFEADWGGPVAVHFFAPSLADDEHFCEWWARLLRQGTSPHGAKSLVRLYPQIDVRDILPAIAVPTVVIHRTNDLAIQVAAGRYLAQRIPGARWVELPGNDHIPWVGDMDAIVDEVEELVTGTRHHREVDRVLATVMFTDIVGSTERAAGLGDRGWRDLVERHDAIVRDQLERYGGRAVKTMGDGFLATFDGPARGIRCARSIADSVRSLGIEIRVGLHTGECEVVGDDVAGMAINIGARVSAQAKPGEVLVSSTVRDLVVGSGIEFADRGQHELKGVPGTWRLFAVTLPGSPTIP